MMNLKQLRDGLLLVEDLNYGAMIKQGDKTLLRFKLINQRNPDESIVNKDVTVRVMRDFQTLNYEKTVKAKAENVVEFSIDNPLRAGRYYIEFKVGDAIYPSDHRFYFDVTPSGKGIESNIIEIVGVDTIVSKVLDKVDTDVNQAITDLTTTNQAVQEAEAVRAQAESERSEKYESYAQQFNDVILDLSEEKDYHSLPEISAARGGHNTLGQRLDETTAQLAQTKDDVDKLHIVKRDNRFKHFAHMGSHASHVANSMNAFKKAVDEGYFGVEMDISQTSDGEFVLMHDEEISQVTTGTGKIREVTFDYLQTVTLKDNRYPGQKVPTLKEVLLYFRNTDVVPLLDLKYLDYSNDTMEKLVDLIVECGMEHQTIIQTQWIYYLNYIRSINKGIFLVWLKDATLSDLEEIKDIPLIGIATIPQLTGYVLPEDAINFAKAHNIFTLAFIGASPARIKGAYNQRMDGVIVDNITQMGGALYV